MAVRSEIEFQAGATTQHSLESDRHDPFTDSRSIAPSDSISFADDVTEVEGEQTPRAGSPTQLNVEGRRGTIAPVTQPYRGFPSEAAYLAALHAWADSKQYTEQDTALVGFYGQTTVAEYCSRPKLEGLGIRRKLRERKEKKEAQRDARRNTVA